MSVNLLVFLVSAALWVASYQVARRWVTWLSAALAAAAVIGTLYLVVEWLASEPMVASYTRGDEAIMLFLRFFLPLALFAAFIVTRGDKVRPRLKDVLRLRRARRAYVRTLREEQRAWDRRMRSINESIQR